MTERGLRTLVGSTDSSGMFGWPQHWKDIWGFALSDPRFKGFEMVGWGGRHMRFWTEFLIKNAQKTGCNIVGIHGRTGGLHDTYSLLHRIQLGTLNHLIIPTTDLVRRYGTKFSYILVHTPELRLRENRVVIHEHRGDIRQLSVENHIRPGAVGSALELVRELRRDGVNAALTFDLVHYTTAHDHRPRTNGFRDTWNDMLRTVDWILGERDASGAPIPVNFHVPVGVNPADSLPTREITDAMWSALGARLDGRDDVRIVMEYQSSGTHLFLTTPKARHEISGNLERSVEALDRACVI